MPRAILSTLITVILAGSGCSCIQYSRPDLNRCVRIAVSASFTSIDGDSVCVKYTLSNDEVASFRQLLGECVVLNETRMGSTYPALSLTMYDINNNQLVNWSYTSKNSIKQEDITLELKETLSYIYLRDKLIDAINARSDLSNLKKSIGVLNK